MGIALEAMMGVMLLVTLYAAPPLHAWVKEFLRHNPGAGRFVHLVVALFVIIPVLWMAVAEFDRRTVGKSPEIVSGIALGLSASWFAASVFLPVWLLVHRSWDAPTKELYRLLVGVFLFSYVVLFVWWAADAADSEHRFRGHTAWVMPVATVIMLVLEFLLLKLGLRLFPPDQPQ